MDVEAQDDGVMVKIVQGDGSKGVKVGGRIAVTAESGDDPATVEIPAGEAQAAAPAKAKEEGKGKSGTEQESPSQAEAPPGSKPTETEAAPARAEKAADSTTQGGKTGEQKYPLYPAVQALLLQNGLAKEDASKIPASGPGGRLLKGKVKKDYPASAEARITKLGHLDLSNIQLAAPAQTAKATPVAASAAVPELAKETEVALPISLSAVLATQKRVQETLGISLPLSVFIARASELSNEDLPVSKSRKPTAEDLFNSVLGLDTVPISSRGSFMPQVTSLGSRPAPRRMQKKSDILDLLTSKKSAPSRSAQRAPAPLAADGPNMFSVTAPSGEEKRAMLYLERLKLVLETEPGRLVL
ncbi:pyridoxine biosynthesis protein [Oleoguttula sp. CCFEE 5521]